MLKYLIVFLFISSCVTHKVNTLPHNKRGKIMERKIKKDIKKVNRMNRIYKLKNK